MALVESGFRQILCSGSCSNHGVTAQIRPVTVQHGIFQISRKLELRAVHINAAGFRSYANTEIILQCQSAQVADLQHGILHMTRLPQSIGLKDVGISGDISIVGLGIILILQANVQITGDDLVHAGGDGVGEPSECRTNQHDKAEHQTQHAQ